MKKIVIAIGILVGLIISVQSFSQNIDRKKMNLDLEVAENILSTLANKDADYRIWGNNIEGAYVDGYGIILTLPGNFIQFRSGSIGIGSSGSRREATVTTEINVDSIRDASISKTKDLMKTFLADYSDLIGQLKSSDKIMVVQKRSDATWRVLTEVSGDAWSLDDARREGGISAEVSKSDVIDYKQGKITRDQLISKIAFNENIKSSEKKDPDLEIFSTTIGRLYRTDLSDTYFASSSPSYDRLPGFGVIYSMRVYSSRASGSYYSIPTLGEENVPKADRDKKVEELFPKFEQNIKENLVQYGRMIKSLKEDENLMMKIRLTECKDCNMPESIDLTIKKSVLSDYEKGSISLSQAVSKIVENKYPQK